MPTPITDTELLAKIDQILHAVNDTLRKDETISQMHGELMRSRAGIVSEVRTPVLNSMLKLTSRLAAVAAAATKLADSGAPDAFTRLRGMVDAAFEFAQSELEADFNVQTIIPEPLVPFDRKQHTAIDTHPAMDESLDSTIAMCQEPGYRDMVADRMIHPAKVIVYKHFQKPAPPQPEPMPDAPAPADDDITVLDAHESTTPAPEEAAPQDSLRSSRPAPTEAPDQMTTETKE